MPVKYRLLLIILLGLTCPNAVVALQLDEVREAAAYSHRVNELIEGFGSLINRTTEYDDLAYGIVQGDVSANYARRQARILWAELWSKFKRLTDELEALPGPPASVQNRRLRGALSNLRSMADLSKEMARSFIASGEEYLEAALSGDDDVIAKLEIRFLKVIAAQLEQEIAHFDTQLAYEDEESFGYPLTAAMKISTEAVLLLLHAALETLEGYDENNDEAVTKVLNDAKENTERLIEVGFEYTDNGRKNARRLLLDMMAYTPQNSEEERLKETLIYILEHNIPQSIDIEERILVEILELSESYGLESDEELDAFLAKVFLLEEERAHLLLDRLRRIAEIQQ